MTKELTSLIKEVQSAITSLGEYNGIENFSTARRAIYNLWDYLDEFFSQNVVIPKGENRHPCADVIHQIAEDMSLEYQVTDMFFDGEWADGESMNRTSYRTKPQEPVYEYKWEMYYRNKQLITADYLTESEIDTTVYSKLEYTKRVRQ